MAEIVRKIGQPSNNECIALPMFDPEKTDENAKASCTTAGLCMRKKPVDGSALMIMLSKVMQGSASA